MIFIAYKLGWAGLGSAGLDCGGGRKLSDKLIKYEYSTSRLTLLTEVKRKQKLDVHNRALLKALDLNIFLPTKNPVRQLQLYAILYYLKSFLGAFYLADWTHLMGKLTYQSHKATFRL